MLDERAVGREKKWSPQRELARDVATVRRWSGGRVSVGLAAHDIISTRLYGERVDYGTLPALCSARRSDSADTNDEIGVQRRTAASSGSSAAVILSPQTFNIYNRAIIQYPNQPDKQENLWFDHYVVVTSTDDHCA